MKEQEFLKIINSTLDKNSHIGDDCAYIKDAGIVITHDSLVEDIHFSQKYSTPYQLGYKAISVNLSDIYASGAAPKYLTISISMPAKTSNEFISEFYRACNDLANKYKFEIIGGDITGSEKIFISICAIGLTKDRKISSRANAKVGDYIITTGNHGSSAAGLWILEHDRKLSDKYKNLTQTHLFPIPQENFSKEISQKIKSDYAMMDTSDGLADALYKIAESSKVSMDLNFEKIPYDEDIENIAKIAEKNYINWILYGGEDFQLVACVNEKDLKKLTKSTYKIIGRVIPQKNKKLVNLNIKNKNFTMDIEKTYNHFTGEKDEF